MALGLSFGQVGSLPVTSQGVSTELSKELTQFYRDHKQRQQMRAAKIKIHDLAQKIVIQLIQRERHNEEQREADRQESARKEHEEEVRRQAERKELEMKLKRKWDEADVFGAGHCSWIFVCTR